LNFSISLFILFYSYGCFALISKFLPSKLICQSENLIQEEFVLDHANLLFHSEYQKLCNATENNFYSYIQKKYWVLFIFKLECSIFRAI